ncbi:hypothetical protein pSalSNUABM01_156 [Salmonella phage pSal-SNUABM-01]|nr:hypothetical protein pSalSNUABM01_156 [Salmonella phage pSal-SNUABM-01]
MKTFVKFLLSVLFLVLAGFFWLMGGNMLASVFLLLALWPVISVVLFGNKPAISIHVNRDVWGR